MTKKVKNNLIVVLISLFLIVFSSITIINVNASQINYLKIEFDNIKSTAYVGETITVGEVKKYYPDKVKSVSTYIMSPSGESINLDEMRFVPQEVGEYKIYAKVTGFNNDVFTDVHRISISKASYPILSEKPTVPTAFICGFDYFDMLSACFVDYNTEIPSNADYTLSVKYASGQTTIVDDSLIFDNALDDSIVELTYKSISSITGGENVVSYNVPIVATYREDGQKKLYDYKKLFLTEKTTDIVNTERGVAFYGENDFSVSFINPVYSDFSINFSTVLGKDCFDSITFSFEDVFDELNVLTLNVKKVSNNKVQLTLNEKNKVEVYGDYTDQEKGFSIIFDHGDLSFKDDSNATAFTALTTIFGTDFNGFTDSKVKISFKVNGVLGEGGVVVRNINKQKFQTTNQNSSLQDKLSPYARTVNSIDIDRVMGDRIEIPSLICYDVIDPTIDCYVTCTMGNQVVKDINGIEIKKLPATENYYFDAPDKGRYTIYYECSDVSGNSFPIYQTVYVNDNIAPTLSLQSDIADTVKVGESIKMPECDYEDNYTQKENLILFISISGPGVCINSLDVGSEFTFEKAGTYFVTYSVYDENYNAVSILSKIVCE